MIKYIALIFLTIILPFSSITYGQGSGNKNSGAIQTKVNVRLIKTIPGKKEDKKRSGLQFFSDLIFGKNEIVISRPVEIVLGSGNNNWILSQENGRIIVSDDSGLSYPKIKSKDSYIFPSLISGCYVDKVGLLFTDSSKDMIYLVDNEGSIAEFCSRNILKRPAGITYNKFNEEIWVAEPGSHSLSVFDKKGNLIKRIGERGAGPIQFNFPTHICSDDSGRIYIVDAMNFRIQILNNSGEFISSFGELGDASGKFSRPKGIDVDSKGNIYVADALFNNVQIFSDNGTFLYYFGNKGSLDGEFIMPSGVRIDEYDNIYVSDSYNNRIQIFKLEK